MSKIACVAVVKNEERHISEWVAYQLAIGFDTVILLDNLSTDATAALAGRFAERYDVRVVKTADSSASYQTSAYMSAIETFGREFTWMAFFDADEFLVLDADIALHAQLARHVGASAIGVSWAMFGSSGILDAPPGLTIENFLYRSTADFGPNKHIKSIVRPDRVQGILNGHSFDVSGPYVDLAGRPITWDIMPGVATAFADYAGGKLHHYFVRSRQDWDAKIRRGYPDLTRSENDFEHHDQNQIFDDAATRFAAGVKDILAELQPVERAPGLRDMTKTGGAKNDVSMQPRYDFVIAACARWETRYIVEWLNYHREIGFDHVFLYCNDDDPAALYEAVLPFCQGKTPFVTFRFYPDQGQHRKMMLHFLQTDRSQANWICFLDIDEFIRLPPEQSIATFVHSFQPAPDCLLFNWTFFGPNGHVTPPDQNVLTAYTAREAVLHPLTKYVARSELFDETDLPSKFVDNSFVHRLSDFLDRPIRSVNVLGEDMSGYYGDDFHNAAYAFVRDPQRQSRILETAAIHHYAFRSEKAFTDRVERGLLGDYAGEKAWGDLALSANFRGYVGHINATEDRRLADFWQSVINRSQDTNVLPEAPAASRPSGQLISRRKPATQSSISPWSVRPDLALDAAGAVNGKQDGSRKFHTALEDNPWWQLDLTGIATIREVLIYNTDEPETAGRFKNFVLSVSIDGATWIEIVRKLDHRVVGVDHEPFIWHGPGSAWARYLRITLLGYDYLHLDQVEVYGTIEPAIANL